jgi:hypothetical protein
MRWYRSKVDWWMAVILSVQPLACVAVGTQLVLGSTVSERAWAVAGIGLAFGIYIQGRRIFSPHFGAQQVVARAKCVMLLAEASRDRLEASNPGGDVLRGHGCSCGSACWD